MKLQKLAALTLALSSIFTFQMTQAESISQSPVELAELAKLPVKTIVPITAKTKEQALAQAKIIANNPDADLDRKSVV